jgi:hypothetical protein
MNNKYKVVITKDGVKTEKEYKTLKEISDELNIELHLIRKIYKLSENMILNKRAHFCNKDLYERAKIFNIKKDYKI